MNSSHISQADVGVGKEAVSKELRCFDRRKEPGQQNNKSLAQQEEHRRRLGLKHRPANHPHCMIYSHFIEVWRRDMTAPGYVRVSGGVEVNLNPQILKSEL
jgi:hypothetical protein